MGTEVNKQNWTGPRVITIYKSLYKYRIFRIGINFSYFNGVLRTRLIYTGLFEMIVGVLTTCHTQCTWDSSICIFLFNSTTLQVFVTYLTGALYVHPLWFYKHQHDDRVRSKLSVACQRWWFQWRFWFVPSVPGYLREEEEHKLDPWRNPIQRNHVGLHVEKEVSRLVVKTPTIIFNNLVYYSLKECESVCRNT